MKKRAKRKSKKTRKTRVPMFQKSRVAFRFLSDGERLRFGRLFNELNERREAPVFVWTTAGGERVRVTDMDEGHLRNTISYLQRRLVYLFGTVTWMMPVRSTLKALAAMLDEAERRGLQV